MSLVLLVVAVLLVGVVAAVASGRMGGGLDAPVPTSPHRPLPPGPVGTGDVDALRFSLGLRGYRMDEVDAVLARLRDELADRDARLAALTGRPPEAAAVRATPEPAGRSAGPEA